MRQPIMGNTYSNPNGDRRTVLGVGAAHSPTGKEPYWVLYRENFSRSSQKCSFEDFWRWTKAGAPHKGVHGERHGGKKRSMPQLRELTSRKIKIPPDDLE